MISGLAEWKKLKSGADIRGSEKALTEEFTQRIGYAFAHMLAEEFETTTDKVIIAVGYDPRESGKRLKDALIQGMKAADSDVLDCGLCTTPSLYRLCDSQDYKAYGAIMITASQYGADKNGFKFIIRNRSFSGSDAEKLIESAASAEIYDPLVTLVDLMSEHKARLNEVIHKLMNDVSLKPLLGLKIVVDAGNGAGGFFAHMLEELGVEIDGSMCLEPDGSFPNHMPDSEDETGMEKLAAAVIANRADMGILLNADCDKVAFVDGMGRRITGNRMIALIAAILLEEKAGATIVTDSVTSSGLTQFITEWGGIHYRFKRGHRNVIDEARRLNEEGIDCPIAIETSGHCAFRENGFVDDGMYLAARVICQVLKRKRYGMTISSLIDELKEPVEAIEIRLPIPEDEVWETAKDTIEVTLSHILEDPEWQLAPDNREGARILFNLNGGVRNAWFQIRLSVHDPVLVLNAESDIEGGIDFMLRQLYCVLKDSDTVDPTPIMSALQK